MTGAGGLLLTYHKKKPLLPPGSSGFFSFELR